MDGAARAPATRRPRPLQTRAEDSARTGYPPRMEWSLPGDLPPEELRRVLAIARRRTFSRGEVVFHEGDPGDALHLIAEGRFAVRVSTPLGERATLAIRGAGEAFGELALITRAPRSATVAALEPGETYSIQQAFDELRRDHPGVNSIRRGARDAVRRWTS